MDETTCSYKYQHKNLNYEGLDPYHGSVKLHAHYGIVLAKDARLIIVPPPVHPHKRSLLPLHA